MRGEQEQKARHHVINHHCCEGAQRRQADADALVMSVALSPRARVAQPVGLKRAKSDGGALRPAEPLTLSERNSKYRGMLDSENSIGLVCAFLGGCSASMLNDAQQISRNEGGTTVRFTLYVGSLALCCTFAFCSVVINGALVFSGTRMLTGRLNEPPDAAQAQFARWWSEPTVIFARRLTRDMSIMLPCLLLFALSIMMFTYLETGFAIFYTIMFVFAITVSWRMASNLMILCGHRPFNYKLSEGWAALWTKHEKYRRRNTWLNTKRLLSEHVKSKGGLQQLHAKQS